MSTSSPTASRHGPHEFDVLLDALRPGRRAVAEEPLCRPVALVHDLAGACPDLVGLVRVAERAGVGRHLVTQRPAQQPVYRQPGQAALDVPDRAVDGAESLHRRALASVALDGAVHDVPDALVGPRVLAHDVRSDQAVDQERLHFVYRSGEPRHSLVRFDLDEDARDREPSVDDLGAHARAHHLRRAAIAVLGIGVQRYRQPLLPDRLVALDLAVELHRSDVGDLHSGASVHMLFGRAGANDIRRATAGSGGAGASAGLLPDHTSAAHRRWERTACCRSGCSNTPSSNLLPDQRLIRQ